MVEIISLSIGAAHILKQLHLLFALNPLCNHTDAHNIGHAGDCLQDSHALTHTFVVHVQKFHINFQDIYIHIFKHVKGGVTAAKIIHQHGKARGPQFLHHGCYNLVLLHIGALRNFDLYKPWVQAVTADEFLEYTGHVQGIYVYPGYVDRYGDRFAAAVYPFLYISTDFLPDIQIQLCHQTIILQKRDEHPRSYEAPLRVIPAHQRFKPHNLSCPHVALGLGIEGNLAVFQGPLYLREKPVVLLQLLLHAAVIPADPLGVIALHRRQGYNSQVVHIADSKAPAVNAIDAKGRKESGCTALLLHIPGYLLLQPAQDSRRIR